MSKTTEKAVEAAKQDFVRWFLQQPQDIQYELATTAFSGHRQIARFRRLFIKTMGDIHSSHIKHTVQQVSTRLIENRAQIFFKSYAPIKKRRSHD